MIRCVSRCLSVLFGVLMLIFFRPLPTSAHDSSVVELSVQSRLFDKEEVNAMPGQISMTESQTKLSVDDKLATQLPISLSMKVKHIDINEDLSVDLPTHLESRQLGLGTKFPLPFVEREDLFMGIDLFPTLNTDAWHWEDSAFRLPFRTYLIYKAQEELILVAGLQVRVDYDDVVLPVLGLIYKPNDRLSFNLASDSPNISYEIDEKLTAFWEFDYALDEYEVKRDTEQGVVLKYREFSTGWGVKYGLTKSIEAFGSTGAVFARRLQYRDDQGKVDVDPTVYIKFGLRAKF